MASNLNRLRNAVPRAITLQQGLIYVLGVAFFLAPLSVAAQDTDQEDPSRHRYRVELLLFTLKNPAEHEYLGQATAPSIPADAELLHGQRPVATPESDTGQLPLPAGERQTAIAATETPPEVSDFSQTLLPTDDLRLTAARSRLLNSGRYNIEFFVAWNEAFPPGHKTPPLLVQIGPTEDGYADIEGYIQIERQRYLHVTAQLYDLALDPVDEEAIDDFAEDGFPGRGDMPFTSAMPDGDPIEPLLLNAQTAPIGAVPAEPGPEVISWMRETRRMRSGEIHFMDSPTMGLLVYFEPLD